MRTNCNPSCENRPIELPYHLLHAIVVTLLRLTGFMLYCLLPALIICLPIDYDCGPPQIYPLLVIDPCLIVLLLLLPIKIKQMDLNENASSLQYYCCGNVGRL